MVDLDVLIRSLNEGQVAIFKRMAFSILKLKSDYDNAQSDNNLSVIEKAADRKIIRKQFEYPIYTLPECASKKMWSGFISHDAVLQYIKYINSGRNKHANVNREHFFDRAWIIDQFLEGDWCKVLVNEGWQGLVRLYYVEPGFGKFHITTKAENNTLKKIQQQRKNLSHNDQYDLANIVLYRWDLDIFSLDKEEKNNGSWWKNVSTSKFIDFLEHYKLTNELLKIA